MSKILHLKSENIQRIKVVDIRPKDNLVVVGGKNGEGKTSTLDSIMFLFGGKKSFSEEPVRSGADKGTIHAETEDFIATRTIYPTGKTELEFRPKVPTNLTPAKFFESILSKLTFDPLAFAHMEKAKQVEVLKGLISFDFSGNETYRRSKYDERTFVNRELKAKQAENEANPFDPTLGIDEFSPNALLESIREGQEILSSIALLEQNIQRGKSRLAEIEVEKKKIEDWLVVNEPKLVELRALKVSDCQADLEALNAKNARIRKNAEAKKIYVAVQTLQNQSNALTAEIERLDSERMAAIENAALPVAGLTFADDVGVKFGGVPFSQLSGAERLKVSLAMGIALNPSLRVLLIRDGSLLDEDNLKVVAEMAERHDMQVWIERVGKGEECSVVLEDGVIVENRMEKENGTGNDDRNDTRAGSGASQVAS